MNNTGSHMPGGEQGADLPHSASSDPKTQSDDTLRSIEKRRNALLEELAYLNEQEAEMTGEPVPPTDLEGIVAKLNVRRGQTLEEALVVESSFPRPLILGLARHANTALIDLIHTFYDKRLKRAEKQTGLSVAEIASKQEYVSLEEMRARITHRLAGNLFRRYLTDEVISFRITDLKLSIDKELGIELLDPSVAKQNSNETMAEVHRLLTKIVYQVARDIVTDQATQKSQELQRYMTPSEYAKEYTGQDLSNLLESVTTRTAIEITRMIPKESESEIQIDAKAIRHTALNYLNLYTFREEQRKGGRSFDIPDDTDAPASDGIDVEIKNAIEQSAYEHAVLKEGQRGVAIHRKLEGSDLAFINSPDLIIRLAGYDADGKPMESLEPDLKLFASLEKRLLEWKKPFIDQPENKNLTPEQRQAIQRFHEEGGHVGPLSREAIEFIRQHGVILFIERRIREDLSITLGSISALSRTPSRFPPKHSDAEYKKGWQFQEEVLRLFPQYDVHDLILPKDAAPEDLKDLYDTTEKRIFICRSSILSVLTQDVWRDQWKDKDVDYGEIEEKIKNMNNQSLRRLGFAGRLKLAVFKAAEAFGSEYLSFNIGMLRERGQGGFEMVNKPSREHNKWMGVISWHDKTSSIGSGATMFWTNFGGRIKQGLEEFTRPHGLVSGKGWDIKKADDSTKTIVEQIDAEIKSGEHAPW